MKALQPLTRYTPRKGAVTLCILDGIALGPSYEGNAVFHACTPNLDWLMQHTLSTTLKAHGTAVGMPSDGDMGNSEVGHNAIGSGRVVSQGATLVDRAFQSDTAFSSPVWKEIVVTCVQQGSTFHTIGLLSNGNVHSHIDHLLRILERSQKEGIKRLRVHILLDGRDVGETSALDYVDRLENLLKQLCKQGVDYRIASGGGRMRITMDRYGANWNMVKEGWDTHVRGIGRSFPTAREAILTYRKEYGVIDQDLPPFVIATEAGKPVGPILDHDAVLLLNFRGDRAMELCNAFELKKFSHFDRGTRPQVLFAGMMEYDSELQVPQKYLVSPPSLDRTIGEYLSCSHVTQFAISETQKFGHVTYFFNGNRSGKFDEKYETYVEITSDIIPFEQRPWMKAAEITDNVLEAMYKGKDKFIRLNYPNGDMVGHTGKFQAAVLSVEAVDLCLGRLLDATRKTQGILIVTADHGNADEMYEYDKKSGKVRYENGKPKSKTNHTLHPVPCCIFDPGFQGEYAISEKAKNASLGISSLAATCLHLLGFSPPNDYDPSIITFTS